LQNLQSNGLAEQAELSRNLGEFGVSQIPQRVDSRHIPLNGHILMYGYDSKQVQYPRANDHQVLAASVRIGAKIVVGCDIIGFPFSSYDAVFDHGAKLVCLSQRSLRSRAGQLMQMLDDHSAAISKLLENRLG
jgi:hypothetical protein